MTKFISILIGCSLALTAGVRAEKEDPKNKQKSKTVQKQQSAPRQRMMPNTPGPGPNTQHTPRLNNTKAPRQHMMPNTPGPGPNTQHTPRLNNAKINEHHVSKQNLPTVPSVQSNKHVVPSNNPVVQANKQTMQKFHPQHQSFHAKPNSVIVSAQFNQNFHIRGSERWQGNHYEVFKSYHPQWHDRGWWHSHHTHIVLIGGGWYYWNGGYWYPAWGYDTNAAYYPYDGPIYVGNNPTPFDQVVADVQASLQEQGYYHGEVDGLVGPLTQQALGEYQRAQGLEETAAIDEPTLASLGLA